MVLEIDAIFYCSETDGKLQFSLYTGLTEVLEWEHDSSVVRDTIIGSCFVCATGWRRFSDSCLCVLRDEGDVRCWVALTNVWIA